MEGFTRLSDRLLLFVFPQGADSRLSERVASARAGGVE
jgi:hypothetical protein